MNLWFISLAFLVASVDSLVLVNQSNLCEECTCSQSELECIFSSSKSRSVSFFGVEAKGWTLSLSGPPNAEIQLSNVHCASLTLSGFRSVIFSPGKTFCNFTSVAGVESVLIHSKSSFGSMHICNVSHISVRERAFFNLKEFKVENVNGTLELTEEALKSRGSSLSPPEAKVSLHRVKQIPNIPHNAFSLSHSVLISHCNISHIHGFAFGGISIHNVTFVDSRIRRLDRAAFPDMTLIRHLHFLRCELTSLSGESVRSAISSLTIQDSNFTSIAERAFQVLAAAKVRFLGNHFPLKSRSLVFKTWSLMEFRGNDFEFLEDEAFLGVSHPTEENSVFIFSQNRIRYANRGALKFAVFPNSTLPQFQDNAFDQTCECFYPSWIRNVVGEGSLSGVFLNTSSCRLSERDASCRSFSSESPNIRSYLEEACSEPALSEEDPCNNPWVLFRERFRPDKDQGILLILLASACLLSTVLIIYSLFRWIVFLTCGPKEPPSSKEEEWNFTQIEPLKPPETPSSSGVNHYDTPKEPLVSPIDKKDEDTKSNHRKSIVPGPTLTFYDEMIGFIKEKLDDPDNYATVSDNAVADEYADPFEENRKE